MGSVTSAAPGATLSAVMGGYAAIGVFCLLVAGCSCGAIVIDSSAGGAGGAGKPHTRATGGAGGKPSKSDGGTTGNTGGTGGTDDIVDAGEDLIGPRSGSVIDVEGTSVDGHPAIVQSVRDTAHGVDCDVQLANDGTMRCLPVGKILPIRYADPDCKTPIALGDAADDGSCNPEAALYAVQKFDAACPAKGQTFFKLGAPIAPPAQIYAASVFGCDPVPFSASQFTRVLGATPSPAAEWIAFKHEVKPITNRLGVAYWTGSDGSQLIDSAWLLEQDAPCRYEVDESGAERCVPSRRVYADRSYFTDNTCKTNVALTFECNPPELLSPVNDGLNSDLVKCLQPTVPRSFYTAQHVDSLLVYSTADGASCSTTKYGGFVYYGPGKEVLVDTFPPLVTTHAGSGRIQRMFWTSEGKRLYAGGLYDTELDGACDPTPTRTGSVCQLEDIYYGYGYYADKSCSVPLYVGAPTCKTPKVVLDSSSGGFNCNDHLASLARRVLKEHVGPAYTSDGIPEGCAPAVMTPGNVLYDLGESVAPEKIFATLATTKL